MKRARPKNKKQEIKMQQKLQKERKNEVFDAENEIKEKGKTLRKVLFGILAVLIVGIFVVMGFGLFDDTEVLAPLDDGKINVLLLGVDEEGLRTDAIMLASYDVNEAKVNMLSIPRDTKIYIENRRMTRKINEIHALSAKDNPAEIMGAEATAEVISQLTGIPINYYAEFSFSAIDTLFDILGPVEYDVPDVEGNGRGMNYDDPYQNLYIHLKPGVQKLSGNQVQQFLRYRKSNSGVGTGSDTDRVERQKDFLKAVADQKLNVSILVKLPSIFNQISKEIKTNISMSDVTRYIRYINKLSAESISTYSLPGEVRDLGGSYFVTDIEEMNKLATETFGFAGDATDKVTLSDEHSQKVLRAGNKGKVKSAPTPEVTQTPELKVTATPKPTATPEPTETPEATKAPVKTPGPTKVPLEDLDENYEIILD